MAKPRVSSIIIENVLGLEKLEVKPGGVTLVTGRNGQGKTSFLEAVRSVLRGGHDVSLLRRGAEKGSVRIIREDGVEITKRITAKSSPLDVRMPGVGKVSQGQAVVDALCDDLAIDPLALISAKPKDRPRFLLDLVKIDLSNDEIAETAGIEIPPVKGTALERLELVRSYVYDRRRDSNRTAKDKRATEGELRATLPAETEPVPDAAAMREQRAAKEAELREVEGKAQAARHEAVKAIQTNAQAELDAIREDAANSIREIERTRDEALQRVKDRAADLAAAAKEKEQAEVKAVADRVRPELEALAGEVARAEEREKEHARAERTREILAKTEKEAAVAEMEAAALSAALARLDALKAAQLEKLPVPGLEARQDDLYFDGIPFERLNSARQIELGVRLAALRAGDSGLVVVDHGEALDADGFAALKASAHAAGVQLIVARVTDGPLTVTTGPAEAAA